LQLVKREGIVISLLNYPLLNDITEEEYRAFIGKNSHKYLRKFNKFWTGNTETFAVTWHWPAFLAGFWWLLYRKLYIWALAYFILMTIPYVNFFIWIACPIVAHYLYYKHAKGKISALKVSQVSPDILKILPQRGGVHSWVPFVAVLSTAIAFIMFILGSILSLAATG